MGIWEVVVVMLVEVMVDSGYYSIDSIIVCVYVLVVGGKGGFIDVFLVVCGVGLLVSFIVWLMFLDDCLFFI